MAEELLFRPALEQVAAVRAGEASSRELVEAALAAIERLDGRVAAFVRLSAERALAEAAEIRAGDDRPLAGVPLAVKDLLALTEGIPTTFGMRAMAGWVPSEDSALVRRLRGAGAVVVGKTNTPELGILPVTEPRAYGPTRNPWDLDRTAGGSSGGSAAAVAAGMVSLAHGNDGGGSIRIPAACCGVVGLKPSRGRTSVAPAPNDPAGLAVEGSLTRSVADTALVLDVISGYEPGDPYWAPEPAAPFLDAARRSPPRLRVAFTAEAPNGAPVSADCRAAVAQAARLLASLGHEVDEAAPEWRDDDLARHFRRIWIAGVGTSLVRMGALRGRPIEPEETEPLTRAMREAAGRISAPDYATSINYLRTSSRTIVGFWDEHDVLLTPTLAEPPIPLGALEPPAGEPLLSMLDRASAFVPFTPPWNVTGQPAISLPLGRSADGLPVGVQLVGRPAGEELLLSLAGQIEAARPWQDDRPPVCASRASR